MRSVISATELKQYILAMMRGDGFTDMNHSSGKARLDIYHCEAQREYLEWKAFVLSQVTGITCRITQKIDKRPLKGGGTRKGWRLQTNFSRYLFNLKQTPDKYKFKQLVKPCALAVLWQDDGTLIIRKRDSSYSSAVLCSDAWPREHISMFSRYFNDAYGWCMLPMEASCRGTVYPRLRMRKKQMEKFSEIVKSYTHKCMMYKLL